MKILQYLKDVFNEFEKIKRPSSQEVITLSVGVIAAVVFASLFFYLVDTASSLLISKFILLA